MATDKKLTDSGQKLESSLKWCENYCEISLTPILFTTIYLSVVTAAILSAAISSIGQGHVSGSGDTLQHASVTAAVQHHCSVCVLSHGRGLVAGLQNTAAAWHQHCRNCTHLQISLQNSAAAALHSVSPTLQKLTHLRHCRIFWYTPRLFEILSPVRLNNYYQWLLAFK